ncbi:MAG: hydroxymethylbilane synthase [Cytophagales bacterium]|nr:hydroxymethylbilane synthase [Cytophagales bacterium]
MYIKIGTRSSKLAMWQAQYVQKLLTQAGISSILVPVLTKGDKILDVSLSKIGSKGLFTEELELQLKTGEIDLAVHSAKDLQSILSADFKIIAYTHRELVHDVVLSLHGNNTLTYANAHKLRVGSSSTRRIAFIKRYYPDIQIVNMRGNLQTRLQKLTDGMADAMLLAYAGVHRMQMQGHITETLSIDSFVPPAGQGSIAVECTTRMDEAIKNAIRNAVNDTKTEICIQAERNFLATIDGGCSVPVFCHACFIDNERIFLRGGIISLDGHKICIQYLTVFVDNAIKAGEILAKKVLRTGGKEILDEIKNRGL